MIPKEHEELISRYDDPDLSTSERDRLRELLEVDDTARSLEAQYRRLDAELERLPDGLDEVDLTALRRRILDRIESGTVVRYPRRRSWVRRASIAAAASVAIGLISLWYVYQPEVIRDRSGSSGRSTAMGRVNKVQLAMNRPVGSETVVKVNRVQLSASPTTVPEPGIAIDTQTDSLYDFGSVICFIDSKQEGLESQDHSIATFFNTLLKGST